MIRDVFERGRKVDLAFISVGALATNATIQRLGLIDQAEVESLRKHGAVGDLSVHWLDDQGRDGRSSAQPARRHHAARLSERHPLRHRRFRRQGQGLGPAWRLAAQVVDVLITDEATAAGVLAIAGHAAA